jgi:hypothetical protein
VHGGLDEQRICRVYGVLDDMNLQHASLGGAADSPEHKKQGWRNCQSHGGLKAVAFQELTLIDRHIAPV